MIRSFSSSFIIIYKYKYPLKNYVDIFDKYKCPQKNYVGISLYIEDVSILSIKETTRSGFFLLLSKQHISLSHKKKKAKKERKKNGKKQQQPITMGSNINK